MKKLLKIAALLVAVTMLFTGCGETTPKDYKGEFIPLDESNQDEKGYYRGGTYTNEYFGFSFDLDEKWGISNDLNHSDKTPMLTLTNSTTYQTIYIWFYDLPFEYKKFPNKKQVAKETKRSFEGYIRVFGENGVFEAKGDIFEQEFEFLGKTVNALGTNAYVPRMNFDNQHFNFVIIKSGLAMHITLEGQDADAVQTTLDECFKSIK